MIRWARERPRDAAAAFYNRGMAWRNQGKIDRAIDDYDQALRLRPTFAEAWNERGIAVRHVERGGEVTYHGPGHLVMYPIVALRENGISLRVHIRALEAALIAACAAFDIAAERRDGAPGCWVGERKIGAVGVRVERGVAWHGLALNVGRDLAPFDLINPCGHAGVISTSIALEQDWVATARGDRDLIGAGAPDLRSVADLVATAYERELVAYGMGASVYVNSAVPAAAGGSR